MKDQARIQLEELQREIQKVKSARVVELADELAETMIQNFRQAQSSGSNEDFLRQIIASQIRVAMSNLVTEIG